MPTLLVEMTLPVDGTMGSLLIGVIVCAMFYGVSLSQMYYYYTRYPRDPVYLKLLVAAVWFTDSVHQASPHLPYQYIPPAFIPPRTAFYSPEGTVYWYLVTQYGEPASLGRLSSTIIPEVFFQAFTGLFVQSFFAARIWKLSGRKPWLVGPVIALIVAEFSIAMGKYTVLYAITALSFKTFLDLGKVKVRPLPAPLSSPALANARDSLSQALSISINAVAAAGDVVIAAILCTILQFSKTGFERSDLLINRLIVFSVNTGLLTSICACMSLITILALPDTFIYICFYFLIGRLYSNSLMATLNARKALRTQSNGTCIQDTAVSLRDLRPRTGSADALSGSPFRGKRDAVARSGGAQHIAIRIDTTEESRRDGENENPSTKYGIGDKDSERV
ncbi:hypothetical protein OH77DRAFT_1522740 [Trametes cingulata]|nr:hypothetical protein OH77DRAFT_1522740 [Trametes cingulata]